MPLHALRDCPHASSYTLVQLKSQSYMVMTRFMVGCPLVLILILNQSILFSTSCYHLGNLE